MSFFKNKLAVTIVVLSISFLVLIGYSIKREKVSVVESGTGAGINFVEKFVYNTSYSVKNSLGFIFNFSEVKKEDEELRKRNSELESKAIDYDSLKAENERLRQMLNFKNQQLQYDCIGCDIIGKSGGNFLDGFRINKGSKDGIANSMIVVTSDGLVGQVTSTADNWAIVQTLANENIAVGALVKSTRENNGIIKGYRGDQNSMLAKLYYLPLDSKIKNGDIILTSGIGGIYPKGIKIGHVISVEEDKGKIMKTAIVQPYVDFDKLEEVFVVVPNNKSKIIYDK